jgi:uncharacterized protein (UPF0261 family)
MSSDPKSIVIIGTLDTKGPEFFYLKEEIEKRGCSTITIDIGILGKSSYEPEINSSEVAEAGGTDLEALRKAGDRRKAIEVMMAGGRKILKKLFDQGRVAGIISMGGGGGTLAATNIMRSLPIGIPKIMISTIASGDVSTYIKTSDILMMPSIVDISGINQISRIIFSNAAGAICGMASGGSTGEDDKKPLIAVTMFGNTNRAATHARKILEKNGFEVLVFHATGTGGKTMEKLIESGKISGVLDITTTEWADEICGGVISAGPKRLEAAGKAGIPQVVLPGCIDMCNFWAQETIPAKYEDRLFYRWGDNVTLMRTSVEDNIKMGKIFAEKINSARGPAAFFIPMGGFSEIDMPGKPFWWPEADRAFADTLKQNLRPDIYFKIVNKDINDPGFIKLITNKLIELLSVS